MSYMVTVSGQEYGPADLAMLKAWADEGRIDPSTPVRNVETSALSTAGTVPGLWAPHEPVVQPAAPSAPPPVVQDASVPAAVAPYGQDPNLATQPIQTPQGLDPNFPVYNPVGAEAPSVHAGKLPVQDSPMVLLQVGWQCAAALVLFFVFRGIGVIFAGFAVYDAIRILRRGNKWGIVCVAMAGATLLIVLIGWFLRIQSGER